MGCANTVTCSCGHQELHVVGLVSLDPFSYIPQIVPMLHPKPAQCLYPLNHCCPSTKLPFNCSATNQTPPAGLAPCGRPPAATWPTPSCVLLPPPLQHCAAAVVAPAALLLPLLPAGGVLPSAAHSTALHKGSGWEHRGRQDRGWTEGPTWSGEGYVSSTP